MKNYSIRTDLAIEVTEMITKETEDTKIEGVELYTDNVEDIEISWVKIKDEKGQETMGKPIGNYVTIESEAMKENDVIMHEKITDIFSKNLVKLCNLNENNCRAW